MAPLLPHLKRFFGGSRKNKHAANERTCEIDRPNSAPRVATVNTKPALPKSPSSFIVPGKTTTEPPSMETNLNQQGWVDPWTRAFEIFQERNHDQDLVTIYKNHVGSFQGNTSDISADSLSPSSVEAAVNKLVKDRERRQWKITINDKEIKIRTQFEKLVKFVLWSDDFVATAVKAQPYAALAWSGVSLIMQLLTSGMSQNEDMLEGFNTILDLQMYWQICEQKYLDLEHRQDYEALVEPLAKLYSYMIEYQAQVLDHLASPQRSRAWKDIQGTSLWSGPMENINKLDQFCRDRFIPVGECSEIRKSREEQLQALRQTRDFSERILQHMVEHRREDQERRLLEDFAKVAGDYKRYKDSNPTRVSGTCEWFLKDERFTKWNSISSSDLLWVSANPGCGKSVLSKSLLDEGHLDSHTTITITSDSVIHNPKPVVTYFFFKEGGEGKMDGSHALCALLHQLFTFPSTSNAIMHALPFHKANGTTLTSKFSDLWQILVDSAIGSDAREIICVLDALDECDKGSRGWILEKLKEFYSDEELRSKSKLKFLVTSRPISHLEYSFENFPKNAAYVRLDGDEKHEQIREEIDLVIDAEVELLTRKFSDRIRNAEKIKSRLKSMENRTYLWLYLTLDYIKAEPTKFAKPADVDRLLSHLPKNVSEAYEKMLSGKKNDPRTNNLLQLVLAAERPLTLIEANVALTLGLREQRMDSHTTLMDELWSPEAFEDVVKEYCGLFISVHDSELSFIHLTAREFLTRKREKAKGEGEDVYWEGRFSAQQSHSIMLQVCLDYLLIPDIGGPINEYGRLSYINDESYHFLSYSGNYWPSHFIHCGDIPLEADLYRVRILCDPSARYIQTWTFVSQGFLYYHYGWSDWTYLGFAAYLGLKSFARLLLEGGADINKGRDKPLQLAADRGHEEIVKMLLENGADPSGGGANYSTALVCASLNGYQRVVQLLLSHGANPNEQSRECGTALAAAAGGGYEKIIETLLKHGADVNTQDEEGNTALAAAAGGGYEKIIETLLKHGADINDSGKKYGTALHAAAAYGHQGIFEMLLHRGADINASGKKYGTALHAAASNGHRGIFEILLHRKADINAPGGIYGTALENAAGKGYQQIVETLLSHGANVNIQNEFGETPLHEASLQGHQQIVETLLRHGAEVNIQSKNGDTPLREASVR
ncbi:hypothetical protein ABOM_011265, partial [Aspergillus bombycis]